METPLFPWGTSNFQQLSASFFCLVLGHDSHTPGQAGEAPGQCWHQSCVSYLLLFPTGEVAAAPSLSFLSSAFGAGFLQPRQFVFPLQRPSLTLLQLLLSIPWPHRSSPVPISLCSYGDLYLCSPFCNSFPCLLF